jgi:hypothetical protein
MGLSDRLKDLQAKAQDAVVEHSEQIHSAVEKAATVADQRTGGKYREHIQKVGAKAGGLVESLKDSEETGSAPTDGTPSQGDAPGE